MGKGTSTGNVYASKTTMTDGRLLMALMAGICSEYVSGKRGQGMEGMHPGASTSRRCPATSAVHASQIAMSTQITQARVAGASIRGWPCTLLVFRPLRHDAHAAHVEHAVQVAPGVHGAHACSPCCCTIRCRTNTVSRRGSSRARTRLACCVYRSAHGWLQPGVASVVPSGRVRRHALLHLALIIACLAV